MTAILVNGLIPADAARAISSNDRGLNYGDGLFETALFRNGQVRFLESHLQRLRTSCDRLGMVFPDERQLRAEITTVCESAKEGVLKIVLTRGVGGRGYRPTADLCTTRIVALGRLPDAADVGISSVTLRWCETRLGRNALLAGMKHLNRLEQVLAQREWDVPAIDEGLMLDTEGELVCGTMSNVFIVSKATLVTPDLRFCGVRGVMRSEVLRIARELGIATNEEAMWPADLEPASEVFITSAVRGVRGVAQLESHQWDRGPITQAIAAVVDR